MTRLAVLLAAAAALSGCQTLRDEVGGKFSPDEFAVTKKAALVIPPGFNLLPPNPGAPPTNVLDANASAAALFGGDAATVAANIPGSYTAGERMLLASVGVNRADPGIRQRLQGDRGVQSADAGFTARLLGTTPQVGAGAIDANAEFERRRGAPPPVAPRKSSGGWFDWF
jgi:hypothetical protein